MSCRLLAGNLYKKHFVGGILLFLVAIQSSAQQSNGFLFLDAAVGGYVDYLLTANMVELKYPLLQPYTYKDVFENDIDSQYFESFKTHWLKMYALPNKFIVGLHVGDSFSEQGSLYRMESILGYSYANFMAINRTRIYKIYTQDSLFAGDLSESDHWLYGRVNDAFLDYYGSFSHLFVGKMDHNWGPPNSPSLILSNNPYTYNKLIYAFSTPKLRLSLIFSKLEDSEGYVYHYKEDTTQFIAQASKFLTGHRLDINVSEKLKLAFSEMAIYGGEDRAMEFDFLNPLEFYYGAQRNDGALMSGLWAADLSYRLLPKTLIYGQFLLDDIIINNDPGVNDRARYPDRLGAYISIRSADLFWEGTLIDLSYTRIWNRTYQTYSFFENYHYRGRSLGYPHVSSEEIKLRAQYWGNYPHFISSHWTIGRYGAAEVTDMFYLVKEDFPIEPVTFAAEHKLRYGWFKYTHLRLFLNHTIRYESLEKVNTTTNTFSLDLDYTLLR